MRSRLRGCSLTLFAICLVLDEPSYLVLYLKHAWKRIYIRHLLMQAECKDVPKVIAELNKQSVPLEELRKLAGVTEQEKATIRCEQLAEPLPLGTVSAPIGQFPTPGVALRLIRDPDRSENAAPTLL